jgi:protein-S-isoprenylcysteine O-methyltransferase Ste14
VPLVVWTLRSLGENVSETVLTKENHRLVREGPYRWVRHPLYASGSLLLLGISLASAIWFLGIMSVLVILIFRWFIVPKEESALVAKFGDGYLEYRRRTGAMLPKWRP